MKSTQKTISQQNSSQQQVGSRRISYRVHHYFWACVALATLVLAPCAAADQDSEQWPRFRGPQGDGHTAETNLPVQWNASNIVWKTPLPGEGQSSPVVWHDRIFLTSALQRGKQRLVFCVDRQSGKILWRQTAWTGDPEPSHSMNGWASATCATDGQHVYASFGFAGVHCYTVGGEHVWSRELGQFLSPNQRGTSASLALVDDLLVFNGDSKSDPFLFALDKTTGQTRWKTERPATEGYSTPIVVSVGDQRELVLNSDPYVAGYDIQSGQRIWWCKSFTGRGEPVPAYHDGVLYVVNGKPGDVYAVRPGGRGDVTKTHMVWHTSRRKGRDQPSPIVVDGYLLVSNMKGLLSCYQTKTGKELWTEPYCRGEQLTAAPFAAAGLAYFQTESGKTLVVKPGPQLKIVAENSLGRTGEMFRASPAPSKGQIFIRSNTTLYCIGRG